MSCPRILRSGLLGRRNPAVWRAPQPRAVECGVSTHAHRGPYLDPQQRDHRSSQLLGPFSCVRWSAPRLTARRRARKGTNTATDEQGGIPLRVGVRMQRAADQKLASKRPEELHCVDVPPPVHRGRRTGPTIWQPTSLRLPAARRRQPEQTTPRHTLGGGPSHRRTLTNLEAPLSIHRGSGEANGPWQGRRPTIGRSCRRKSVSSRDTKGG